MKLKSNNYAFIDGANLHGGVKSLGWRLDYKKFRVWLKEKYSVSTAYIFLGLISKYNDMYTSLQEAGFTLVFKEVVYDENGKPKGNCDADLVVKVMQETFDNIFDKAVIVSSDGDYSSLIKFLISKQKLEVILSPAKAKKCSILLKRTEAKISYIDDQKNILSKPAKK